MINLCDSLALALIQDDEFGDGQAVYSDFAMLLILQTKTFS